MYHTVTIIVGTVLFFVFKNWTTHSLMWWMLKAMCLFVAVNLLYIIVFFRNKAFIELRKKFSNLFKKVLYGRCKQNNSIWCKNKR